MTTENKILIAAEDIIAIHLICECGADVSIPVKTCRNVPTECVNCKKRWMIQDQWPHEALAKLAEAATAISSTAKDRHAAVKIEVAVKL